MPDIARIIINLSKHGPRFGITALVLIIVGLWGTLLIIGMLWSPPVSASIAGLTLLAFLKGKLPR